MTHKEKLLEYIKHPTFTTTRNSMGCSENWYNSFYAMMMTFSKEEIELMPDTTIEACLKIADIVAGGLY